MSNALILIIVVILFVIYLEIVYQVSTRRERKRLIKQAHKYIKLKED